MSSFNYPINAFSIRGREPRPAAGSRGGDREGGGGGGIESASGNSRDIFPARAGSGWLLLKERKREATGGAAKLARVHSNEPRAEENREKIGVGRSFARARALALVARFRGRAFPRRARIYIIIVGAHRRRFLSLFFSPPRFAFAKGEVVRRRSPIISHVSNVYVRARLCARARAFRG